MFIDYKADVEKPLPMIYQSGYLTIKDYDMESNEFLLDFPNNEVRSGFLSMLASGYLKSGTMDVDTWISAGIKLLKRGETTAFRDSLTAFLSGIPYDVHPSLKAEEATEKHFQYTFYLILRLLGGSGCTLLTERHRLWAGWMRCWNLRTMFISLNLSWMAPPPKPYGR